jgi:hypothetical protein
VLVYWLIFLALAAGALLARSDVDQRSLPLFVALASIPTVLMIGLRWEVGPDWPAYTDIYRYSTFYTFGQSLAHADPGYFAVMWFSLQRAISGGSAGDGHQFVQRDVHLACAIDQRAGQSAVAARRARALSQFSCWC